MNPVGGACRQSLRNASKPIGLEGAGILMGWLGIEKSSVKPWVFWKAGVVAHGLMNQDLQLAINR